MKQLQTLQPPILETVHNFLLVFICILHNFLAVNFRSETTNCSCKYSSFYLLYTQPDDGCLRSRNILICVNKTALQ